MKLLQIYDIHINYWCTQNQIYASWYKYYIIGIYNIDSMPIRLYKLVEVNQLMSVTSLFQK